jgi:hypothetical protein
MIEYTLYYIGKLFFSKKIQHVYKLWPAKNIAGPSQILGQLQFKTMYLYSTKTAPMGLLT